MSPSCLFFPLPSPSYPRLLWPEELLLLPTWEAGRPAALRSGQVPRAQTD